MTSVGLMVMSACAYSPLRGAEHVSRRRAFAIWTGGMVAGGLTMLVTFFAIAVAVPQAFAAEPSVGLLLVAGAVLRWVPVSAAWWVSRYLTAKVPQRRPIAVPPAAR